MKKLLFCLFLFLFNTELTNAKTANLVNIPVHTFIPKGDTNIKSILHTSEAIYASVEKLFINEEIHHETIIYSLKTNEAKKEYFKNQYWPAQKEKWNKIVLNKDTLLIFSGFIHPNDDKEIVELYDFNQRIYAEEGKFIAFSNHTLTKEKIIFIHKYPCCYSASHNIISIRYLSKKIKSKDRFFVGRDSGDMKGDFFPDSIVSAIHFERLEDTTTLYWSSSIIESDAFIGFSESNRIADYEKGAYYKTLFIKDDWHYVLIFNGILDKASSVINPVNFKYRPVYGWIQTKKS